MQLSQVEKQRTGLLQLLIFLIMVFLGLITWISFRQGLGHTIPALSVLALLTCLYVMSREETLKRLEGDLIQGLVERERRVAALDHELKVEHAELEEEKIKAASLGNQLSELTRLYRAISTVNAVMETERTFETVLYAALDLVKGDRGSIMLVDDEGENLFIASALGLDDLVVHRTKQPIGEGVSGWVAETGDPLLLSGSAKKDGRFQKPNALADEVHCAMSVPLLWKNKVAGVLNLGTTLKSNDTEFTESDLRIATIFGQHASVAILNARLDDALGQLEATAASVRRTG